MHRSNRRPIQATIRTSAADDAGRFDRELREALSHWASSVAVLAATDGEEIDAITVTAFTALSMEPPLVLACIGEHASVLPMIREERRFTISMLAQDQRAVASTVAQRLPGVDDLFESLDRPAVLGRIAALDCSLWEEYPGGDHRIVIGRVDAVSLGPDANPLLYHRRGYTAVR